MSKQSENEKTLKEAGFVKDNEREMWISKERRMAFAGDTVKDQLNAWVRYVAGNEVPADQFAFYVDYAPKAHDLFRNTLKELGFPQLAPVVTVLNPDLH